MPTQHQNRLLKLQQVVYNLHFVAKTNMKHILITAAILGAAAAAVIIYLSEHNIYYDNDEYLIDDNTELAGTRSNYNTSYDDPFDELLDTGLGI